MYGFEMLTFNMKDGFLGEADVYAARSPRL